MVGYSILSPKPVKADMKDIEYAFAAGALYSSVEDLYKWNKAIYTDKLIKNRLWIKSLQAIPNSYGYGWYISDDKYGVIAQHEGGIIGSHVPYIENVLKELDEK